MEVKHLLALTPARGVKSDQPDEISGDGETEGGLAASHKRVTEDAQYGGACP